MTTEQFTAVLVALGVLVTAMASLLVQVNQILHEQHKAAAATNGRVDQLVQATADKAHAEGLLEGRRATDFRRLT
jgi:hypothetical protein